MDEYKHESLVGFGIGEARTILAGYGKKLRVIKVGEQSLMATQDYNPNRLNVEIEALDDKRWIHCKIIKETGWG